MIELIKYDARDNTSEKTVDICVERDNASKKMIGIYVEKENTWWHFFFVISNQSYKLNNRISIC